jgi:hypothetical protein
LQKPVPLPRKAMAVQVCNLNPSLGCAIKQYLFLQRHPDPVPL